MIRKAAGRLVLSLGLVLATVQLGLAQPSDPPDSKGPFDVSAWTKDDPDNGGQDVGTYREFRKAMEVAQKKVREEGIRKVAISWTDGGVRRSRVLTPPARIRPPKDNPPPSNPPVSPPSVPPGETKAADDIPASASARGKYSKLLKRIEVPQDRKDYGNFHDYGYWDQTEWAGYKNLPRGFWVYVYPNWYIWGEKK